MIEAYTRTFSLQSDLDMSSFEFDPAASSNRSVHFSNDIDSKMISRGATLRSEDDENTEGNSVMPQPSQPKKSIPELKDQIWMLVRHCRFLGDIERLTKVEFTALWGEVKKFKMAEVMYDELRDAAEISEGQAGENQRRELWGFICHIIQSHVLSEAREKRALEACLS